MPDLVPVHYWKPSSIKRQLVGNVVQSPGTISGAVQVLRTDGGGLWRVDFSGISLRGARAVEDWWAWQGALQSGAALVNVPMASVAYSPMAARRSGGLAKPVITHAPDSDVDRAFPSVGPYGTGQNAITATMATAALRATTITITITKGSPVRAGMFFGVTHATGQKRVYRIVRIMSRNGMAATVMIEPPLREAVTAVSAVDFEWPSFLGRLIPDQDISPDLAVRHGGVSISFMEAFQ